MLKKDLNYLIATVARNVLQVLADGYVLALTIAKTCKIHKEAKSLSLQGNFSLSEFLVQDGKL